MELTINPGTAASIDADEFELICHYHSHSHWICEQGINKSVGYPVSDWILNILSGLCLKAVFELYTVCPGSSDPTLNIESSYFIQSSSFDLKLFCSVNE